MIGTAIRRARAGTNDRGASAVEFALIVPILIVLVFGIIGVTRFTEALGLSALVFLGSIALIIVAQTARAIFDAADAASDLVRLERYRLGLDDDDN